MTLRRRMPLLTSKGTLIPLGIRTAVNQRDPVCVGRVIGLPGECIGGLEMDHVRASGAIGMKSASIPANLVRLCAGHHDYKTNHGREVRPRLIAYIDDAMERSETIG